jgi:hypothetical protein
MTTERKANRDTQKLNRERIGLRHVAGWIPEAKARQVQKWIREHKDLADAAASLPPGPPGWPKGRSRQVPAPSKPTA